jgi:hypothetical protein
MNLHELKTYAVKMAKENPTLKEEIYDIVDLAISEVEEGGFETSECCLAKHEIELIVSEKMFEDEMQKSNSTGEDKTVHGYTNLETHIMIVHIHNNQEWLEDAFDNIRRYNNPNNLKEEFKMEIFNERKLSDTFGLMSFERINWREIFNNLKGMMPKESYEELEERLALANTQARILFDMLRELGDGADTMVEELSHAHNIKLLTDVSSNEWKYQD